MWFVPYLPVKSREIIYQKGVVLCSVPCESGGEGL